MVLRGIDPEAVEDGEEEAAEKSWFDLCSEFMEKRRAEGANPRTITSLEQKLRKTFL
ncbi:hypothetical protein Salmuc_04243 [Salipiger mucosus DSM 16094]|uniref:Uncharacterized protein n=1 Tax=Salipiger mucosus DSM 16094 TaxID=1123237 RepID=S9QFL2_9RHOB|nr:hypothetical protein Salmuc_04243 [Salipiger mucosus DSM 16094]